VIKMKNILLTISTAALLLVGQSAIALSEDNSGYELLTSNTTQVAELPTASYRNTVELEFRGNESDSSIIPSFEYNSAGYISGGNESQQWW